MMRFKDLRNISNWILYPTLLFWLIENMYFGWNATPINESETFCDLIVRVALWIWFVIYVVRINKLLKFVEDLEEEE